MKIDWSAYRITLLLYLAILLIPVSFYFSYRALDAVRADALMVQRFTLASADTSNTPYALKDIKPWMQEHEHSPYYVGSDSLMSKYDAYSICKNMLQSSDILKQKKCFKQAKSIIFSLQNMVRLKQKRVSNMLYVNLAITVALLIFLVFAIRAYVHKELAKHAIYDLTSTLHTKEYMLSILKEHVAQAKREKQALSLLFIHVTQQEDKIIKQIAKSLFATLRESDVASRYSEDKFLILLPNTEKEKVVNLVKRLDIELKGVEYKLQTIAFAHEESYEELLEKFI